MTTRLNKSFREEIAKSILQHRFQKTYDELMAVRRVLGDELYQDTYSPELQAQMKAMPDGFLPKGEHLQVHIGTGYRYVTFGGNWTRWHTPVVFNSLIQPPSVWRLVARNHENGSIKTDYSIRSPIGQLAEHADNLQQDLVEKLVTADKKVTAALRGWNIQTAELNAMLDLPPE